MNLEDDNRVLLAKRNKLGYANIKTEELLTPELLGTFKYVAWNMKDNLQHFNELYNSDLLELFKLYTYKLAVEYQELTPEDAHG